MSTIPETENKVSLELFVFVFKAKRFVIAIAFVFLQVEFSGRAAKLFLANVLRLIIKEECDRDLTCSLDTPNKIFLLKLSPSCYSRHLWHMTRLRHGNQHSQHAKDTGNSQKLENMLASK